MTTTLTTLPPFYDSITDDADYSPADYEAIGVVFYWSAAGREADAAHLPERLAALGDTTDGWLAGVMLRRIYEDASAVTRVALDRLPLEDITRGLMTGSVAEL